MNKFDFFKEYYKVDPTSKTGVRWAKDRGYNVKAGWEAGSYQNSTGYWQLSDGNYGKVLAHQVVYYLTNGEWSSGEMQIDHIDGDKLNNRIENLRMVTGISNQRNANRRVQKNNTSGYPGVGYYYPTNSWRARYAGVHLGYRKTKEEAYELVKEAKENDPLYMM